MTTQQLTPEEIESLRIAIAEECGWKHILIGKFPDNDIAGVPPTASCLHHPLPPYTTSLDAIQKAAMERFKGDLDAMKFGTKLANHQRDCCWWQLSALDWCIAFARTAKIWRWKV